MTGAIRARADVAARTGRLDEDEVRQLALQLKSVLREGVDTFGELAAGWLKRVGKRRVEPKNEQRHVRHLAALHGLKEGELTVERLEEHRNALSGFLSNQTLNKLRSTGRLIIRAAQADGKWHGPNPFDVLPRLKEKKKLHATMSLEEVARALACVRADRRALARVAFFLGPRPGELLGLRKIDVDLKRGWLLIRRSHQRDSTKTGKERRVPIPDAILEDLRAAIAASPSELVFPKPDGKPMRKDTKLCRMWRVALVEAGIVDGYRYKCRRCSAEEQHIDATERWCECGAKMWATGIPRPLRFYDLRHVSNTLHKQAGAHPEVVKHVLGHAAADVNEDVYTHFSEEFVKQQMNLLALPECTGVQAVTMRATPNTASTVAPQGDQERRMGFEPTTPSLGSLGSPPPTPSLMKVPEVARLLRVTPDTVYRLVAQGRLRVVRVGSLIRVPSEELDSYLRGARDTSQHDEVAHVRSALRCLPSEP